MRLTRWRPMIWGAAGTNHVLNNPREVEVYIDSSTQQLNTQAMAASSTLRFYRLMFNDHGTWIARK
jgi:hypothetical protein